MLASQFFLELADGVNASITWLDGTVTLVRQVPCGGWVVGPSVGPQHALSEALQYALLQEPVERTTAQDDADYVGTASRILPPRHGKLLLGKRKRHVNKRVRDNFDEQPDPKNPLPYDVRKARPQDESRVTLRDMLKWSGRVKGAEDPSVMLMFRELWQRATVYTDALCHCDVCTATREHRIRPNHETRRRLRFELLNRHAASSAQ